MINLERFILHIDVNNAFLSWTAVERLKRGESLDIRTVPSVIGGDESKRRGIVLAKSMMAKQVGIQTGEALYVARQKCSNLLVVPSEHETYRKYSKELYNLFLEYTDKIEQFSIDECFLDMSGIIKSKEMAKEIAKEISGRIKKDKGYTVNIGISTNKLLAKMASDFEKPNKIHTLFPEEIEEKMWRLPISELFMVGKKSLPKLEKMNIKTIGDLAKQDRINIIKKFGKFGSIIWEYANGIDNSEVIYKYEKPKGIGNSITLPYDISNIEKLNEVLLSLITNITYRLRKEKMIADTVTVHLKTKEFINYSHSKKIENRTDSTKEIYEVAKQLLSELHKSEQIRLIGARVEGLSSKDELQISLFDKKQNEKQQKLDKVLDELKDKYGYKSISKAGELNTKKLF